MLQNYMMERFLERVSLSKYAEFFILKGGFLIASMIGVDIRSTRDLDATLKGLAISEIEIERIITEILNVSVDDNVTFEMTSLKSIHEDGEYEDFRIGIKANFLTINIKLKLDITTGDVIIPREIDYTFGLMFEDRFIQIKTYNLNTILAEKIESIFARNVVNTRARDYYDVYVLIKTRTVDIDKQDLQDAIIAKAKERGTEIYITQYSKYLKDIEESSDLRKLWENYTIKYPYAIGIEYEEVMKVLKSIFTN